MTDDTMTLRASDGYQLAARHFLPNGPARGVVVMAGATGVSQRYYQRFARSLADDGLEVITVDFRGVGASKPATLKGFECHYRHWALDVGAAVTFAHSRGPVVVVGHSFGGHAFGQLEAPNRTLGLVTVATGAAWSGYMSRTERLKAEFMWNVLGPVVSRAYGYIPGPMWGGEDLPLGVFRDWDRWSHFPHYFFDDPQLDMQSLFDRVTVPVLGLTASDDAWAPPSSMNTFLSHYRNAPVTLRVHDPKKDYGVKALGHMGHFKAAALPRFVPEVLAFIDERLGHRKPSLDGAHRETLASSEGEQLGGERLGQAQAFGR